MAGSASGCWWLTATLLKTQTSFAWSSAAQVVNSTTQVPWCLSMTPWCAASRCWSLWRRSENSIARSQTDLPVKDLTWCFYKLLPSAPRHAQAYMWHMHAKEASTSGKGWAFSIFVIIYQICCFGVVYGGISYLSRSEAVSSYSQALTRIDLTPKLPTHLYLAFASLRPWWLRLHCAQLSTLIRPKPRSSHGEFGKCSGQADWSDGHTNDFYPDSAQWQILVEQGCTTLARKCMQHHPRI